MLADVVIQTKSQNESGQVVRSWDYDNPAMIISNYSRGIVDGGIRVAGSTEQFSDLYMDIEFVKMRTGVNLSKRSRIYNIRSEDTGETLWSEVDELGGEVPRVFEILGVTPVVDAISPSPVEYEVLLKAVQDE